MRREHYIFKIVTYVWMCLYRGINENGMILVDVLI